MDITIIIHSSKTMRSDGGISGLRQPYFIKKAKQLNRDLKSLPDAEIMRNMHISPRLTEDVRELIDAWSFDDDNSLPAIDSFIGDIYSGLRANEMTTEDRLYADKTLIILSGLYGALRPLDGVRPYRLEMGYKFPRLDFKDMYNFWGSDIADSLPKSGYIINVSAVEYTKAILPFIDKSRVITPKFLTINPKTGRPGFVAVHSKIARGAFARWMIIKKITDIQDLSKFNDLGYEHSVELSDVIQPVFICNEFGGKGLSVRTK